MQKIILASGSPRRKELLKRLKLEFDVVPAKFNEDEVELLDPEKLVKKLSRAKAEEVVNMFEDTVVIAADTVVIYREEILGKPVSKRDARDMLKKLQGGKHLVMTGLTVMSTTGKSRTICDSTQVFMKKLDMKDIKSYVDTGEPIDKAGAYGIQGLGGIFVDKIVGSYFTVMGLPVHRLAELLKEFSIKIL